MRLFTRRYGTGIILASLGLAIVTAGTAVSLGYIAIPGLARDAEPTQARTDREGHGVELNARIDIDTPLFPVDPLTVHLDPGAAEFVPLPGASVRRDLDLAEAGLGLDTELALASGSHTARVPPARDSEVAASSLRGIVAPAAAPTAAAVAAFTLAGAIAYFWSGVKAWAFRLGVFPFIGLYAKITRAEVFDNSVRERIFAAIRAHPGVSASDLARIADVSWGTTIYHLDVLEQTRMVSSIRKGRYRRYFENGAQLAVSKDAVAVLQNTVTASVVDTIRRAPGSTQKELAAATQMSPQALHWHLARLVEAGLVRKEREGRVVRHFHAG